MTLTVEPARFDWYAATVETSAETLVELVGSVLADEAPVLVQGRHGYGHGWEVRRQGSRAAVVYGGGASEWPHVVGTGEDAPAVARLIRRAGMPVHRVARADVCVDTDTPGAFPLLVGALRAVTGSARAYMIQPDRAEDGATYYVGSKTSEVQARLYEKGKQLPDAGRPDWVRYEVQLRPQKTRKTWAATAAPDDLLGASRWSRRFACDALGVASVGPPARSERVSDLEGALVALCGQYGGRLLELLERHQGDVEAFGLELLERSQNGGRKGAA